MNFNAGWKNGQEEVVGELESFVRGDLAIVTRYRGLDALVLRDLFGDGKINTGHKPAPIVIDAEGLSQATTGTLPEI